MLKFQCDDCGDLINAVVVKDVTGSKEADLHVKCLLRRYSDTDVSVLILDKSLDAIVTAEFEW